MQKIDKLQDLFNKREELKNELEQVSDQIDQELGEDFSSDNIRSVKTRVPAYVPVEKPKRKPNKKINEEDQGEKTCSDCGAPQGKGACKGRCGSCYHKFNYKKRKGVKQENNEERGEDDSRSAGEDKQITKEYECLDCYKKFKSTLEEFDEITCPKCGSTNKVQKTIIF